MVNINIKSRYWEYDLHLQKRLTIISDNSGTGKTTFVELIGRYANKDEFLKCDLPCYVLPLTDRAGKWETYFNEEAVVVIDDAHPIYDLDYFEIFKNAKCYIIMINREIPALIYELSNIYRLKTVEGYHYLGEVL
ncbi:MAG: hypothetical protein LBT59_23200 [Clostridiales bacterium]|nr:hypothetical protein [Clostridiales bacterium]